MGPLGRIYRYLRANGRCPAMDFLKGLDSHSAKKFKGSFDALSKMGASYYNPQRFKPLIGDGKPLWEFKEFDARLYCYRSVEGQGVAVVLLDGWIKDKRGRNREEINRVQSAQGLLAEFLAEFPSGKLPSGGK